MARYIRILIVTGVLLAAGTVGFTEWSFKVTQTPELATNIKTVMPKYSYNCITKQNVLPLDVDGKLHVTVWNIYKQQRDNWQTALQEYSAGSQLVLLQEANLTAGLADYLRNTSWQVTMANAFKFLDTSAGVMNLSGASANKTCAYLSMEPWLQLPKSALFARYLLSNGQELAVVNLHGVNFTLGVDEYEIQMAKLERVLATHSGPMILAGDFNSWRQARVDIVEAITGRLGLREIELGNDQRIKVLGQPLDHLYYRGLSLIKAEAPLTDASDHNPIIASFKVKLMRSSVAKQQ
ncbi:endonuclease/exonuclease/phosphatase family protein [Photobacterium kagoshimensis]|uniref:endonuclease/exonuclease/phosphatase family protein n=1 Tax=Photobacterium kagoshimensis TaxID=2910242 RepID=UPI003D098610